jgi:DNA-binding SARP family transcriptional activator
MDAGGTAVLRVRVLGSLAVSRSGADAGLGAGMRPAVLGLLAVHPNTPVHREAIIDALWPQDPPATAVNQVQAHVGKLRKILDPGRSSRDSASPVESLGVSYLLRAAAGELDLLAFRDLADRARAAHGRGDWHAACSSYEQALSLWRGRPLAELDMLRDHPAVTGLTGQQTAVIAEYARACFSAGLHERALPHLRALAGREPMNEKAHAQLMIALAGAGQQADALQVFGELRSRLDDQLGVYPGADLADAYERVLRQDFRPAAAGAAGALARVTPGEPSPPADLPVPGRAVFQLPPALPDFTGRAAAVSGLASLLTPSGSLAVPVAVISGPPGVGKTTLALQVAHVVRHEFPDGQLHADLRGASPGTRDPADILDEMLRGLGVPGGYPGAPLPGPSPSAPQRSGLRRPGRGSW